MEALLFLYAWVGLLLVITEIRERLQKKPKTTEGQSDAKGNV